MKKTDMIIVGCGLSGLFAACVAASRGKKVQILSYGAGTLAIAGGIVDLLGYGDDGKFCANPLVGIDKIAAQHPYQKVGGSAVVKRAITEFLEIAKSCGYPYLGTPEENVWVPTAIGNFKPSCLVPKSMDAKALLASKKILVVGFDTMKDFYAHMVVKNFTKRLGESRTISEHIVALNFEYGKDLRDINAMDVARWLETPEGQASFISQVKDKVDADTAIVLPPVLGLEPNYEVYDKLHQALGCSIVEVSSIPPAVTGLRLDKMLRAYAKKHSVQIIEKARVVGAEIVDGRCEAVITEGFDRKRKFYADQFIIATGGVYGGGLKTFIGQMKEPILNIDIEVPRVQTQWSHKKLFDNQKQIFAQYGVSVDETLAPLSAGKKVASNVKVIGRSLSGYDFCYEKSGNGVALTTAYKAVAAFCEED